MQIAITIGVVLRNDGGGNGEGEATIVIADALRFARILNKVAVQIKPDQGVLQGRASGGTAVNCIIT